MANNCKSAANDKDDYRIVTPKGTKYLWSFSGTHF